MVARKRLNVTFIHKLPFLFLYDFNTYFRFQRLHFVFPPGLQLSLLCSSFTVKRWDDKYKEMTEKVKIELIVSWRRVVDLEIEFHPM